MQVKGWLNGCALRGRGVLRLCAALGAVLLGGGVASASVSAPIQPRAMVVNAGGGSTWQSQAVLLSWVDTSNNEFQFAVDRQAYVNGQWGGSVVTRVPANTSAMMDAPVNGLYRYRVRAEAVSQASAWSAWVALAVGVPVPGEPVEGGAGPVRESIGTNAPLPPPLPPPAPGGVGSIPDARTMPSSRAWFTPVPSADTRQIHVSSSMGDDANDGTSPQRAVRTFLRAYALARDGMPDHVLLRAGDVWDDASIANQYGGWDKRGRSPAEPMVIGVYGQGERPRIRVRTANTGLLLQGNDRGNGDIAIVGLHFQDDRAHPNDSINGIQVYGLTRNVLIEDCYIEGFAGNLLMSSEAGFAVQNVVIRRSIFVDAYPADGHSGGLYFATVEGLLIDECVLDHNGWSAVVPGKISTIFNHNVYMQPTCTDVLVRNTISSRASATGLQLRGSHQSAINNFLADNPIHITAGHQQARWPEQAWTGTFAFNVITGGADIGIGVPAPGQVLRPEPRGFGLGVGFSGGGTARWNLVARLAGGAPAGIWLGDPNTSWTVEENIIFEPSGRFIRDDRTDRSLPLGASNVMTAQPLAHWPEASRSPAMYMARLGFSGEEASTAHFLRSARRQSRASWNPQFTADAINRFLREGLGMPEPTDDELAMPPNPGR